MAGRRCPMISMALASLMGHASEIWPWSFLESDAEGGVECASCSSVGQSIGRGRGVAGEPVYRVSKIKYSIGVQYQIGCREH